MIRRQLQGRADELVIKTIRDLQDQVEQAQNELKTVTEKVNEPPPPQIRPEDVLVSQGLNLILNAPVQITAGQGSPENVLTGNIGDMYLRQDGGAGTTLYIKESGSNTRTGWTAK